MPGLSPVLSLWGRVTLWNSSHHRVPGLWCCRCKEIMIGLPTKTCKIRPFTKEITALLAVSPVLMNQLHSNFLSRNICRKHCFYSLMNVIKAPRILILYRLWEQLFRTPNSVLMVTLQLKPTGHREKLLYLFLFTKADNCVKYTMCCGDSFTSEFSEETTLCQSPSFWRMRFSLDDVAIIDITNG